MNCSDLRAEFEKACPVPKGVYWDSWSDNDGQYEAVSPEHEELADIQQARLQGWIAARAQQGAERAIGEIDEGEEGVFVELYPDNTFTIGQKVYTHPAKPDMGGEK